MAYPIQEKIDLQGVACPFNFVKTKAALARIQTGEYLELVLDEGDAILNVPRSLKDEGHAVVSVDANPDGETFTVVVRKA